MYQNNLTDDEESSSPRSKPLHVTENSQSPKQDRRHFPHPSSNNVGFKPPHSVTITDNRHLVLPLTSHSPCQQNQPPERQLSWFLWSCVLVGLFAVHSSRQAVIYSGEQIQKMENNRRQLQDLLQETNTELRRLQREYTAVDSMLYSNYHNSNNKGGRSSARTAADNHMKVAGVRALHEMKQLQKKVDRETVKSVSLKESVQREARREVEQQYGTGKIYVLFELVFPSDSTLLRYEKDHRYHTVAGASQFVLEMAPTALMPHAIHTFLSMVSHKLLDGCSFILNALHVIKAAPLPYDGTSAKEKARQFAEWGLESVSFKEYSDDFPHSRHTMAFAADGSPSFYINTADNTEIHAGDPCFGTIVWGFEAVKRLEHTPTLNGIWFEQKIGIKTARVLEPDEAERVMSSSANQGALLRSNSRG